MRNNFFAAAAAMILGLLASSVGAATPESKCYSRQIKAMAAVCAVHAKYWAIATSDDAANACVESAIEAKPLAKVAMAEAGLACLVEGAAVFDDATSDIAAGMSALACIAKGAGKLEASYDKAEAKDKQLGLA